MKLDKMHRVIMALCKRTGFLPDAWLDCSAGGELRITPTCQLQREQHDFMLSRGFVHVDGAYIYRPYRRSRA